MGLTDVTDINVLCDNYRMSWSAKTTHPATAIEWQIPLPLRLSQYLHVSMNQSNIDRLSKCQHNLWSKRELRHLTTMQQECLTKVCGSKKRDISLLNFEVCSLPPESCPVLILLKLNIVYISNVNCDVKMYPFTVDMYVHNV